MSDCTKLLAMINYTIHPKVANVRSESFLSLLKHIPKVPYDIQPLMIAIPMSSMQ